MTFVGQILLYESPIPETILRPVQALAIAALPIMHRGRLGESLLHEMIG